MKIELVPMLQVQRDLYDIPRGWDRFRRYLEAMTGGTSDMVLPLPAMNPMGKEHVAATYDALLAMGAEAIAGLAVEEARRRLARVPGELRVGLVVADDLGGGWTDRYLTEASRFSGLAIAKRGWAVALFWTTETPTPESVRQEVLSAVYEARYLQQHGLPKTLRQMLDQAGLALAFAGYRLPAYDRPAMAAIREIVEPHLETTAFPAAFACLYGDEAAESVGYPPLGLPPRAGFVMAVDDVRRRQFSPVAELVRAESWRTAPGPGRA